MSTAKMVMASMMMVMAVSSVASEKVTEIEGKQGKEVSFSVESNPTTGYSWMIKRLPEQLMLVSSSYEQSADCKKGAVGCSGKETFTFIAQKPGKGELNLIHGQAFDKSSWKETIVKVNIN
ncbi:protease inhibitor I42 family protein [Pantoea sp. B566]|uniref:protease inhibitor I42 family protein n=1 Tax=Pantoea sp. B566 TaxID=2974030 RepID=UPI0021662DAC|nr:protease inhibitor I42 family protein [Pantoea sp. B566]MCS3403259.1 protease inhibitor I42 family protein [Pantoea sp. B566]